MLRIQPDIAYSIIKMLQFSVNPTEEHLQKALYVMPNPDRDGHRSCKVKGSPCVEAQADIEAFWHNNSDRVASKVQGFKESAYSKVKQRLIKVQEELQGDRLMLVVQGRLAWGRVRENYGVYIHLPWEVWPRKEKVGEHSRAISNTMEYSAENILEVNG